MLVRGGRRRTETMYILIGRKHLQYVPQLKIWEDVPEDCETVTLTKEELKEYSFDIDEDRKEFKMERGSYHFELYDADNVTHIGTVKGKYLYDYDGFGYFNAEEHQENIHPSYARIVDETVAAIFCGDIVNSTHYNVFDTDTQGFRHYAR